MSINNKTRNIHVIFIVFLITIFIISLMSCHSAPKKNPWDIYSPDSTSNEDIYVSVADLLITTPKKIENSFSIKERDIVIDAQVEILASEDSKCTLPVITTDILDYNQISIAAFGKDRDQAENYTKDRPKQYPIPSIFTNSHYLYKDGHMMFFSSEQGSGEDGPYISSYFVEYWDLIENENFDSSPDIIPIEYADINIDEAIHLANQCVHRYSFLDIPLLDPIVEAIRHTSENGSSSDILSIDFMQSFDGIGVTNLISVNLAPKARYEVKVCNKGVLEVYAGFGKVVRETEKDKKVMSLTTAISYFKHYQEIAQLSLHDNKIFEYNIVQFAYLPIPLPQEANCFQLIPVWIFMREKGVQSSTTIIVDATNGKQIII